MRIESLREVKSKLSKIVKDLPSNGSVVITKNGRPCAALVELSNDTDLEAFLLTHNHRLTAMIDRSVERGGRIALADIEAELDEE